MVPSNVVVKMKPIFAVNFPHVFAFIIYSENSSQREQRERKSSNKEIRSMAFPILTGINDPVTSWSWRASTRAYSTDQYFHKEEEDETVIYAFKPSFSKKDWFAPENMSSFGEIKMNRDHFPCMRSFSKDLDATVNEAFLKNLEVLFSTSFSDSVSKTLLTFSTSVENT